MKSKKSSNCQISLNKLPRFWDRQVLFLSNIFSLFFKNHAQIEALHRKVGSLETYGGRMLPIMDLLFRRKKNLLLLDKPPVKPLMTYFESLGLTIPDIQIIPKDFFRAFSQKDEDALAFLEKCKQHPADYMTGYVTDDTLVDIAKTVEKEVIGTKEGCYNGNNKLYLQKFLKKNKLPIFDTLEAKNSQHVSEALNKLEQKGYRFAAIKAQIGASGIGMKRIDLSKVSLEPLPDYLFHEGPVLVQGWLDPHLPSIEALASPSLLLFIDDHTCCIYDLTEQILSQDSIHEGNISPPPFLKNVPEIQDELMKQGQAVGVWLMEQGYQGTASIDFHVIKRDGTVEVRVCEINARVTGATYPSVLAKHLAPDQTWLLRNIRFSTPHRDEDILNKMKKNRLLFSTDKLEGILPFNFNSNREGKIFKGQFLFLSDSTAGVNAYLDQLCETFSIRDGYDRD